LNGVGALALSAAYAGQMESAVQVNRHFHSTPGPWTAYEEMLTPNGLHVAGRMPMVRSNGHIIAHIGRFLNDHLNHAICQEAEANGRLISMAPEMFAYIKRRAEDFNDQDAQALIAAIDNCGHPADGNHIPNPEHK
jgi:hypothetical protein